MAHCLTNHLRNQLGLWRGDVARLEADSAGMWLHRATAATGRLQLTQTRYSSFITITIACRCIQLDLMLGGRRQRQ